MPSLTERVLIVPDTHSPYHDKRAWKLMLEVAQSFRPHTIVHMGDLADFYKISSHSKDPNREYSFKQEVEITKGLRGELDELGAKRKVFIEGNHEDRLRRYKQDRFPELADEISTDSLLKLTENDWEFTPYREHAKVGKVYFTHDTGQGGHYTTARALDTFQHSVVIGHHHALQYHVMGDATGQYRVGAQFGWLGDLSRVDYTHKVKVMRRWSLAFGVGYHDTGTGHVFLVPCPIVRYQTSLEGRVFRG